MLFNTKTLAYLTHLTQAVCIPIYTLSLPLLQHKTDLVHMLAGKDKVKAAIHIYRQFETY